MRLFRVFLDHGNPTLSQPSRPIPAVSRTPVFLAAGSFTDVLGISNKDVPVSSFFQDPVSDQILPHFQDSVSSNSQIFSFSESCIGSNS